ncbi:MAG TPA: flagellar export chaperone FliS [Opitutaceae bacterium]|nr:flagellar export chaperone FliS [Opitutaceae bacterium]
MVTQDFGRAYRANSVLTASPGQLVLMLFDGALRSLCLAREACARREQEPRSIEAINKQLLKAQNIIAELQDTLNPEAGDGQFALEMGRLYDYFNRRLMEANLRKEAAPIVEVERLLGEVRAAWAEMLRTQGAVNVPHHTGSRAFA